MEDLYDESVWDQVYSSRPWGRYPPEDLIRFAMRNFAGAPDRGAVRILEIGCGPGANLWFLAREGFSVAGIDGSSVAVDMAGERLAAEGLPLAGAGAELKVGNFATIPWPDQAFDAVVDIESLYANTSEDIDRVLAEVLRVLKPGGKFFGRMFGSGCSAFGQGRALDKLTWTDIPVAPFAGGGVVHFFDRDDISSRFSAFDDLDIGKLTREESGARSVLEEWLVTATKP
tara:strand:- start:2397 stop:3083 length:687 start_codon:yes stop_codon:yes gene_type:complete